MFSAIFFIHLALALAYAALMLTYLRGWRLLSEWHLPPGFTPRTRVAVLVPARNEAKRIGACLQAILSCNYPSELLEVIVVDDHSSDGTAAVVEHFRHKHPGLRLLQAPEGAQGKKAALTLGITRTDSELIVTTDADCVAPPDWLLLLVSKYEAVCGPEGCVIAAPVVFWQEKTMLERFQSLDFLGLMGVTGAGIRLGFQRMGNGANLAYSKRLFEAVGGFSGNAERASGDDMFLLQKIARRQAQTIYFLKSADAAVRTQAMPDLPSFIRQRLRWGTKNAALPEWRIRIVLSIVWLFCWSILWNIVAGNWPAAALQLLVKAFFDAVFLGEMARFFGRRDLIRGFVPSFFLHIVYVALLGLASLLVRRYTWKDRVWR